MDRTSPWDVQPLDRITLQVYSVKSEEIKKPPQILKTLKKNRKQPAGTQGQGQGQGQSQGLDSQGKSSDDWMISGEPSTHKYDL